MIKRLIATALLALPAWSVIAQPIPIELECKVMAGYDLTADGVMETVPSITKYTFMVNRNTGVMMGKHLSNHDERITVFDRGSDKQAFKSVSVNKTGHIHPTYLVINVFHEEPEKSFMLSYYYRVLTGLCK